MLPGYFAGASIVFIWSFTDLGTPLMFEYRQLVAVQIFDMLNDVHENPMGYVLVVFMIFGIIVVFASFYDAYLRWKLIKEEIEKRRLKAS